MQKCSHVGVTQHLNQCDVTNAKVGGQTPTTAFTAGGNVLSVCAIKHISYKLP